MRRVALTLFLLAIPAVSSAQMRRPARVDVDAVFGEGTLLADGWGSVLVEVENRTRTDQHGALELRVTGYAGTSMGRVVALDVPAGQTRRALLSVFSGGAGNTITVRFTEAGRELGRGERSVDYAPADGSVVVFSDPPRLRGALLDLDVETYGPGGARAVRFPVGTVRFDPATADPLLPESAADWSTVRLLVASGPALARMSATQATVLEDWLRSGGELLVFPRSEADLRHAWLRSVMGEIATDGEPRLDPTWVPFGVEQLRLRCDSDQRSEAAGCARSFGLGVVHVAAYDGETSAAIESGAPRQLVRALLASNQPEQPALPFGSGTDDVDQSYWNEEGSFGAMRAALDPNQGFRPALILVALVLMLYVVLVGPLNFRWIGALNRPTLALVTTPLVAAACVLVLLAVGYVGKGVTMRHRRVELVETVEGEPRAFGRRYTGLFSTRPGTFDVPLEDDAATRRIGGGSGDGPVHRQDGGARLVDFRAGLWETTFLREDRLVDLGGSIRFERDGEHLRAVINESREALEGAIVLDTTGAIYLVGDVPIGERVAIPRSAARSVSQPFLLGPDSDAPRTIAVITGGADDADEIARVRGLVNLLGRYFIPQRAPVLYARMSAPDESIGGVFDPEVDQRWLRVRPRVDPPGLMAAPDPAPLWEDEPQATPVEMPAAPLVEEDAASPDGGAP